MHVDTMPDFFKQIADDLDAEGHSAEVAAAHRRAGEVVRGALADGSDLGNVLRAVEARLVGDDEGADLFDALIHLLLVSGVLGRSLE